MTYLLHEMSQSHHTLKSWLQESRKNWVTLTQIAVLILGVLGGFLVPPPPGLSETEDKAWIRLAQFVVTVLVGIVFVATYKRNQKRNSKGWWRDGRGWWIACAVFLLLSVSMLFLYRHLTHKWTCEYFGDTVVIGSEYTPMGAHYIQQNSGIPCNQLLIDFAGGVDKVWTKESIDTKRLLLAGSYIGCIPLFTLCIISLLQALHTISVGKKV